MKDYLLHVLPIVFFAIFGAAVQYFTSAGEREENGGTDLKRILLMLFSSASIGAVLIKLFAYFEIDEDLKMPIAWFIGFRHRDVLKLLAKFDLKKISKFLDRDK